VYISHLFISSIERKNLFLLRTKKIYQGCIHLQKGVIKTLMHVVNSFMMPLLIEYIGIAIINLKEKYPNKLKTNEVRNRNK
jgi:hypothetical protein